MDKEFLYDPLLDDELLPDELFTSQSVQKKIRCSVIRTLTVLCNARPMKTAFSSF